MEQQQAIYGFLGELQVTGFDLKLSSVSYPRAAVRLKLWKTSHPTRNQGTTDRILSAGLLQSNNKIHLL
jgi:hypothetical protein